MELWIASSNKGKIEEYMILLKEIPGIEIHIQNEIPGFSPRPEDGKTFLDNAIIKAKTLKAVKPHAWILGEDAGLEVEGLGGLPGVHTARYAGPKATDIENLTKLLKMMSLRPMANRNAQFRAVTVVLGPQGEEWHFEGLLKGKIALKPAGVLGFGYDPVFIPENQDKTLAELGAGYKSTHSHRAQNAKAFLQKYLSTKG